MKGFGVRRFFIFLTIFLLAGFLDLSEVDASRRKGRKSSRKTGRRVRHRRKSRSCDAEAGDLRQLEMKLNRLENSIDRVNAEKRVVDEKEPKAYLEVACFGPDSKAFAGEEGLSAKEKSFCAGRFSVGIYYEEKDLQREINLRLVEFFQSIYKKSQGFQEGEKPLEGDGV